MSTIQLLPRRPAGRAKGSGRLVVRPMTRVVFGLILLPTILSAQAQNNVGTTAKPRPLVEVIATDHQINSKMKYVFLRAFADGAIEYHDPRHVDLFEPVLLRKNMPTEQLNRLKEILSDPEVGKLSGEYNGGRGVDTSLRWDITIKTESGVHTFTIWNFTYGLEHGVWGRPITKPVRKLGCVLEDISNQAKGLDDHCPQCKGRRSDVKK